MRRHRRRRSSLTLLRAAVILLAVLLLILLAARTEHAVRPAARMRSVQLARQTAGLVIGEAVSDYVEENEYICSGLTAVLYDESGRAASVESLTGNINKVQSELAVMINQRLNEAEDTYAEIPLGTLSGSYLFAGRGPHVRVRICPAGAASVTLESSFTSAGINQTCHRVYARVTAELSSATPLYTFHEEASFDFLLAETVIIGSVPDITYGQIAGNVVK